MRINSTPHPILRLIKPIKSLVRVPVLTPQGSSPYNERHSVTWLFSGASWRRLSALTPRRFERKWVVGAASCWKVTSDWITWASMEDNSFTVARNPPIIIPAPMFPQKRQVGLAAAAQLDQTTGQTSVYFSKFTDDDCKVFYPNNHNRYKTFGALKENTDFELFSINLRVCVASVSFRFGCSMPAKLLWIHSKCMCENYSSLPVKYLVYCLLHGGSQIKDQMSDWICSSAMWNYITPSTFFL